VANVEHHEAHLPAQEAKARPCTRVSRAHALASGAADAQASPRQGAQAPVGVTSRPRAAGRGRLSRSADFERVYRHGRSTANRHLVLYTFPNPAAQRPRLGLSVSRKVGGAVVRNRVKRLLREAFAEAEPTLSGGQDLVVVARPPARELAEREGLEGLGQSLSELIGKAGLVEDAGEGGL